MNAGENPYFYMWTAKAGAINWIDDETRTYAARPKKKRGRLIR